MVLDIYIVDAFTNEQFRGNSAAVVPVEQWLDDALMLSIAQENNLSETAFLKHINANTYEIRWFSPITEIDFCGHATLAAAYVLFQQVGLSNVLTFITKKVGELFVSQNNDKRIEMTFPNLLPRAIETVPDCLLNGLSVSPKNVLQNNQAYFVILENESEVYAATYDSEQLKQLAPYDVVITAQAKAYDFVSRYFWPANGGDEDPVTGSIHAGLAPYWANQLNKNNLIAYQASSRGGILYCEVTTDKITVSGHGILYLKGQIFV